MRKRTSRSCRYFQKRPNELGRAGPYFTQIRRVLPSPGELPADATASRRAPLPDALWLACPIAGAKPADSVWRPGSIGSKLCRHCGFRLSHADAAAVICPSPGSRFQSQRELHPFEPPRILRKNVIPILHPPRSLVHVQRRAAIRGAGHIRGLSDSGYAHVVDDSAATTRHYYGRDDMLIPKLKAVA